MFLLSTSRKLLTQTDITLQELAEEEMNMEHKDFTQRKSAKCKVQLVLSCAATKHTPKQNLTLETQQLSLPLDESRQVVPLSCLVMHCHGYCCHGDEQSDPPIGKTAAVGERALWSGCGTAWRGLVREREPFGGTSESCKCVSVYI